MNWREEITPKQEIRKVTASLQDGVCLIHWHWPQEVPCVYIHKSSADAVFRPEEVTIAKMKLLTREEYKTNGGYRERIDGVGRYAIRIFPCVMEEGRLRILLQINEENQIVIRSGKSQVRYQLKQKSGWFSKMQTVQIRIHTEVPIPREALCYVKKTGEYPLHKDDGLQYAFLHDFAPGYNVLPEIQIGKHDYIRLFFTDGKRYGELYELIPE